eukprot:4455981-Pyramimonas_sp.AAC.1
MVGAHTDATSWTLWAEVLGQLREVLAIQLELFSEETARVANRARSRALSASLSDFKQWVMQNEFTGGLFKASKEQPVSPHSATVDGCTVQHPGDVVEHRAAM